MDEEERHRLRINPILIGLLGVIAGAIMVATYQVCSSICNYRRRTVQGSRDQHNTANSSSSQNVQHINQHEIMMRPSERRGTSSSTAPRLINIPIFRYNKDCNEDTCAVCLGDFKEGEQIRVLPDCLHFFHVSCIDRWLNLHSNCPICRTDTSHPEQVAVSLPEYYSSRAQQPLEVNRLPDFGV